MDGVQPIASERRDPLAAWRLVGAALAAAPADGLPLGLAAASSVEPGAAQPAAQPETVAASLAGSATPSALLAMLASQSTQVGRADLRPGDATAAAPTVALEGAAGAVPLHDAVLVQALLVPVWTSGLAPPGAELRRRDADDAPSARRARQQRGGQGGAQDDEVGDEVGGEADDAQPDGHAALPGVSPGAARPVGRAGLAPSPPPPWAGPLLAALRRSLHHAPARAALRPAALAWLAGRVVLLASARATAGTAWLFVLRREVVDDAVALSGLRLEARLHWAAGQPAAGTWWAVRLGRAEAGAGGAARWVTLAHLAGPAAPPGRAACALHLGAGAQEAPAAHAQLRVAQGQRAAAALSGQWSVPLLVCSEPLLTPDEEGRRDAA